MADTVPNDPVGEKPPSPGSTTPDEAAGSGSSSSDQTNQPEKGHGLSGFQVFLLVFSLSISTFIAALEQTIISTAAPSISKAFNSTELEFTWIGTAYLLPAAAATPPFGKISDIFGRKPILILAIVVFWIGSLIGALATDIGMLIAGRVIQGTGGGGILGLSATVIGDVFAPIDRSKYFGILGVVWGLACGLGPIVGGAFSEYVDWRWCFWINLPVAGVAGVFVFFFLKVDTPKTPIWEGLKAMDWLGTIAVVGATVLFLLGLGYGGIAFPWNSATVVCLIVFGIVMFGIFIVIEGWVAKYPVTPLRLFKSTSNVATFGIAFMHGCVYIGDLFYLPLYFQTVLGASPLMSGVYLLPVAVTLCVTSTATGMYISKTGRYRPPIYVGLLFLILSHGLYTDLKPYPSWPRIIIFQILSGFGLGPLFQAPIIAIFSLTKPADIASAAATVFFMRDIATAMSIVFGGVIFQNRIAAQSDQLYEVLPAHDAEVISSGGSTTSEDLIKELPDAQRWVIREVYTEAIKIEWIFYTALAGIALIMSIGISKQILAREHTVNKTGLDVQEASRLEELEKNKKTENPSAV